MFPVQNKTNPNDYKIVRFTNISDFDFTPEMGAMYGGIPYFVPAGGSQLLPKTLGEHLAKHLARQMLIRKAPIRDEKETDGKGSPLALWNTEGEKNLKVKMLTEVYEEAQKAPLSEAEVMAQRVKVMNESFKSEDATGPAAQAVAPSDGSYKDKAEVVAELKKRNIPFDARSSKANLEKLLT